MNARATAVPVGEMLIHPPNAGAETLRRRALDAGYLLLRSLIAPDDILALRTRVLDACREIGWVGAASDHGRDVVLPGVRIGAPDEAWTELQRRVLILPELERLRSHDAILGILRVIYGGTARWGCGDTVRAFSPATPELTTPPHQDGFYVRGPPDLWTAWIPLGACPRTLGGLSVAPGSHRGGLRSHGVGENGHQGLVAPADMGWVATDYECGDVLFFHGLTVHRSLENRSENRVRVSVDFRYERSSARPPG